MQLHRRTQYAKPGSGCRFPEHLGFAGGFSRVATMEAKKKNTGGRPTVDLDTAVPLANDREILAASLDYLENSPKCNDGVVALEAMLVRDWPAFLDQVVSDYEQWNESMHQSQLGRYKYTLQRAKETRPI